MVVAGVKEGKRTSNRNKNEYEEEKIYHFSLPPCLSHHLLIAGALSTRGKESGRWVDREKRRKEMRGEKKSQKETSLEESSRLGVEGFVVIGVFSTWADAR